uniref:CCHC-type domain-containing protein n=1 Tax=Setaria italica TaxID=4555 RepID=K3Z045_SETIT
MEEEDFDFDPSEDMEDGVQKWFAMARYYSGQTPKGLFDEMGFAWKLYVLKEGPWKHKGDALIVVPYDGLSRSSELVIDSIDLVVSNKVIEVMGPVRNFLRAQVTFPLEEALKLFVEAKIKDKGIMQFEVKYENVPFMCFRCGRMGHPEKFCLEDEEVKVQGMFGDWVRTSPLKRDEEKKKMLVPAAPSRAIRVLKFSGAQLGKVQVVYSATHGAGGSGKKKSVGELVRMDEDARVDGTPKKVPQEVSNALVQSVQKIMVGEKPSGVNLHDVRGAKERVSGLESFEDSSERTNSEVTPAIRREEERSPKSIRERLQEVEAAKAKQVQDRKVGMKGPSLVKDIGKHKRPQRALKAGIMESIRDLCSRGLVDQNIIVNLLSIEDHYIDASIRDDPNSDPWRATFIYGEPRVEDRQYPWVVIGDFNEAMCGIPWTYDNKKEGARNVKQAWEQEHTRGDLGTINTALRGVIKSLKQWSLEHFGSVRKVLEQLRVQLGELQTQ